MALHLTYRRWLHAAVIALSALSVGAANAPPPIADLFVVDCLLPGQLRQLGQRTTYLSARRPAKTTAADCRIRGGEYVAYDRASYRTSLNVWLPRAKEGNAEAQANVGEIFERGFGGNPDFEAAAQWYRKAAAQDNARAQINLGHLYEKGLGVEADPIEALRWYRRASGLDENLELEPTAAETERATEVASLRRRVQQLEADGDLLRDELARARDDVERAVGTRARAPAPTPIDPQEFAAADAVLAALQEAVVERERQVNSLDALLDTLSEQVEAARADADAARLEQQQAERELSTTSDRLTTVAELTAARELELDGLEAQLAAGTAQIDQQQSVLAELKVELARLNVETDERRSQLEALQTQREVIDDRALAGPEIAIIEPTLSTTRGVSVVGVPTRVDQRKIIGRVTAPAGLLALTVNETNASPNTRGVFATDVAVKQPRTPVSIIAVDQQGKRAALEFVLQPLLNPASGSSKRAADTKKLPNFGRYHALIIGNNRYEYLPELQTALNDARAVDDVLKNKYGFKTRLLENASRYQILSALNDYRETLTSNDNLLIFYAGHGDLDKVNQRGHWLPVDAEFDNTANWLSNVAVTDILNIMKARQVLLIVDSCYSGALTRSSIARLKTGMTATERANWLKTMSKKRSRTVLTSGGLAPVLDAGGGEHSVFASALLQVLRKNDDLIDGQQLYREVAARVTYAAANLQFEQLPQYAPIRYAGHETGDFFLLPGT